MKGNNLASGNGLQAVQRRRKILLIAVGLFVFSLICYGIFAPTREERVLAVLRAAAKEKKGKEGISHKDFEKLMEGMSKESRERIMTEIMRDRLKEAREEMAKLPPEKKAEVQQEAIEQIRESFAKMNDEARKDAKEFFNSKEGKEGLQKSVDFMMKEFTVEERKQLDPILAEFYVNINKL
ncbi:MAG: hypothetical protein A2X49_01560 [Lentisphaerae bacterium GWF2_52_8]|nr:MAG: hypothetical protein A2X49_01560 [Lentisphaerae bacterium GWF2_52_8]